MLGAIGPAGLYGVGSKLLVPPNEETEATSKCTGTSMCMYDANPEKGEFAITIDGVPNGSLGPAEEADSEKGKPKATTETPGCEMTVESDHN